MKSPAFQFYVKQWLGDDKVMLMDWDAKGMHVHYMCIAWQQTPPCTLPLDEEILRKWVGNPSDWERLKKQVFMSWEIVDGRYFQKGLYEQWLKQQRFTESRKKNAEARWSKTGDDASALRNQCESHVNVIVNKEVINKDKSEKQTTKKSGPVEEVFKHWQEKLNHPTAALDAKRRALINKALEGYSVENLKLAIEGCSRSQWHMGKNENNTRYDKLNLILRDADHIDSFIKCAKGNSGYVPPVIQQPPRKVVIQNPEVIKAALQKAKETVGVKNEERK